MSHIGDKCPLCGCGEVVDRRFDSERDRYVCEWQSPDCAALRQQLAAVQEQNAKLRDALGSIRKQLWRHKQFANHGTTASRCADCDAYTIADTALQEQQP